MSKKRLVLLGIGSIVLLAGFTLCCLLILQIGSESFSREELIDALEEAYRFDPQTVLANRASAGNIFVRIPFPENFPEPSSTTIFWQQKEYLQVIDMFMEDVLYENRSNWELVSIGSTRSCSGTETELQNFGIRIQRSNSLPDAKHRVELDIDIVPQTAIVVLHKREYAPDEGGYRTIGWDNIVIPAEQALLIAERNGGTVVRRILDDQCRIVISLTAGMQGNHWWVYYEPFNKPSVFEVSVDEKTGKYRILREFEK